MSLLDKNYIYESKLTNGVFLISGGPGDFTFSISAQSGNFEILAFFCDLQNFKIALRLSCWTNFAQIFFDMSGDLSLKVILKFLQIAKKRPNFQSRPIELKLKM